MRARLAPLLVLLIVLLIVLLAPAARAAEPLRLMAFGDSLIHGYGLPAGQTFPDQLQAALDTRPDGGPESGSEGGPVEVINAGSSGETSSGGLARLDWTLAEKPDAVILLLGANDALRGLDPAETRKNLEAMLDSLEQRGIPVLLAGMKAPPSLGADYGAAFDAIYPDLAARHDVVFYPFFLEGVAAQPALNQDDGIHPNAEGVATIVAAMMPQVEALIARARSARTAGNG